MYIVSLYLLHINIHIGLLHWRQWEVLLINLILNHMISAHSVIVSQQWGLFEYTPILIFSQSIKQDQKKTWIKSKPAQNDTRKLNSCIFPSLHSNIQTVRTNTNQSMLCVNKCSLTAGLIFQLRGFDDCSFPSSSLTRQSDSVFVCISGESQCTDGWATEQHRQFMQDKWPLCGRVVLYIVRRQKGDGNNHLILIIQLSTKIHSVSSVNY